ncbi:hypothetical protein PR003_g30611 [Phytophthora rubi]|uniref:Uncharacterized protein n=1 Tax=Phytophthora rubi TaxID=129364 RepID=A0A6A4B9C2_9STRA|nr:hypothetical protein PR003_g30611 [Phytophthora rubi]
MLACKPVTCLAGRPLLCSACSLARSAGSAARWSHGFGLEQATKSVAGWSLESHATTIMYQHGRRTWGKHYADLSKLASPVCRCLSTGP